MKKYQLIIIIIAIILMIISTSGCISNDDNKNKDEEEDNLIIEKELVLSYWYNVSLENLTNGEIIYIPVILDYSGNISKVNDDIDISGGEFHIITTEYGDVIKIVSKNQTVKLDLKKMDYTKTEVEKIDHPHFLYLSLYLDENQNNQFDFEDSFDYKLSYHIFYNGTSRRASLELNFGYDWIGGPTYGGNEGVSIEKILLGSGWNLYNASYGEGHI